MVSAKCPNCKAEIDFSFWDLIPGWHTRARTECPYCHFHVALSRKWHLFVNALTVLGVWACFANKHSNKAELVVFVVLCLSATALLNALYVAHGGKLDARKLARIK